MVRRVLGIGSSLLILSSVAFGQFGVGIIAFSGDTAAVSVDTLWQYAESFTDTASAAAANWSMQITPTDSGRYVILVAAALDNQWRYLDSCYIAGGGSIGTKVAQTSIANIGTLCVWQIVDTLDNGVEYTIRTHTYGSNTPGVTGMAVLYKNPPAVPSAQADTTSAYAGLTSFTRSSVAGDSLLLFYNGQYTPYPGTGVTPVDTVYYSSGSRRIVALQKSSAGNSTASCSFATYYFNSAIVVMKKP